MKLGAILKTATASKPGIGENGAVQQPGGVGIAVFGGETLTFGKWVVE